MKLKFKYSSSLVNTFWLVLILIPTGVIASVINLFTINDWCIYALALSFVLYGFYMLCETIRDAREEREASAVDLGVMIATRQKELSEVMNDES